MAVSNRELIKQRKGKEKGKGIGKTGVVWQKHDLVGAGRRHNHSATLVGNSVYIYAGHEKHAGLERNDFLVISPTATGFSESRLLSLIFPSPPQRHGHTAELVDEQIFILGGLTGRTRITEVLVFDVVLRTWWFPQVRGNPHPILIRHNSVYIDWMNLILCFGGGDGRRFKNCVTGFNVITMQWKTLAVKGTPPKPRSNAAAYLIGQTWYIFGGWLYTANFNDIHLLELPMNGARPSWSSPVVETGPAARVGASFAFFKGNLLLFGGKTTRQLYNDVHIFDVRTCKWTATENFRENGQTIEDEPVGRSGHTLTAMPNGAFLVYGGSRRSRKVPDCVHILELV